MEIVFPYKSLLDNTISIPLTILMHIHQLILHTFVSFSRITIPVNDIINMNSKLAIKKL